MEVGEHNCLLPSAALEPFLLSLLPLLRTRMTPHDEIQAVETLVPMELIRRV
jgi:hypothetical protein